MIRNHRKIYKTEAEFLTGFSIVEKINDYTYIVINEKTQRKTKLHVEDIKLDVNKLNDSLKEEEEDLEEGTIIGEDSSNKTHETNEQNDTNNNNAPTHSSRMVLRPRKTVQKPDK